MSKAVSTSLRFQKPFLPSIQEDELQAEGLLQPHPSSDAACAGEAWHGFQRRLLTAIEALLKQSLAMHSRDLRDMMKDFGACPTPGIWSAPSQSSFAEFSAESKAADLQEEPAGDVRRCSGDSPLEVRIVELQQLLKKSNDENIELRENITQVQHTIHTMQSTMELFPMISEDHDVEEREEEDAQDLMVRSSMAAKDKKIHQDQDHNNRREISLRFDFRDGPVHIDRVATFGHKLESWWNQLEEPPRTGLFYHLENSRAFETTCQTAIILNAILLAHAADWRMKNIGIEKEPSFIVHSETVFQMFFLMELILRLVVHRLYFFVNQDMYWNIFDFFLVCLSTVDFLNTHVAHGDSSDNLTSLRVFRTFRLARVLRSLRLFRFISSLTMLMDAFLVSLNALFWGCIMFCFALYSFSLIFMEGVKDYLETDDEIDPIVKGAMQEGFGSLAKSFLSLFKAVTGGVDWDIYYELLRRTGPGYGSLFLFFMMIATFSIANLISASILERSMAAAAPSRVEQVLNQHKKMSYERGVFLDICRRMDKEGTGKISWAAFKEWIHRPAMVAYMASIDLDIYDAKFFFESMASQKSPLKPWANRGRDGTSATVNEFEVPIEDFVEGCMRMKGAATSIDMQRQFFEIHMLGEELKNVEKCFGDRMSILEKLVRKGFNLVACRDTVSLQKPRFQL